MNPLAAPFLPGLSGTLGQQFTFARMRALPRPGVTKPSRLSVQRMWDVFALELAPSQPEAEQLDGGLTKIAYVKKPVGRRRGTVRSLCEALNNITPYILVPIVGGKPVLLLPGRDCSKL